MRKGWLFPLFVALAGCSTTPVKIGDAAQVPADRLFAFQTGSGEPDLVVSRDSGVLGGGCKVGLYIDGTVSATLKPGEVASFHIPHGQHLVGIGNDPHRSGLCAVGSMALREHPFVVPSPLLRHWRISTDMNSGAEITPSSL